MAAGLLDAGQTHGAEDFGRDGPHPPGCLALAVLGGWSITEADWAVLRLTDAAIHRMTSAGITCRAGSMKAVFNDMQDPSSGLDGATVHDRGDLSTLLESVLDRKPFGCELEGENGYKLTLGIGKEVCFVQHGPSNGDPPYLLALGPQDFWKHECADFLVGDTPSPIPQRFCLPFEMAIDIVAYFLETGERCPAVCWEEI